jgi:predicted dehydrogenase
LVGAGSRALHMFAKPMATEWKDAIRFGGIYDINAARAKFASEECGGVPVYDDFGRMLDEARPDVVIVASTDATHHEYIIRSLAAGCDVITEKPMTIDEEKCRAILQAERDSGKKVTVTFNLRYAPYFAKVKELIQAGAIGDVNHIDLEWFLDRRHGADYFRRWHAEMKNSGGLLVHKATHHFDIVNWWMNSRPAVVHAFGTRVKYGGGREGRGERCLNCGLKSSCEFYMDIESNPFMEKYYRGAEHVDGYIRDRCVFDERIDIYDTMSVNVSYENGGLLTYSLVAYSPYEGWRAAVNGSEGRMELMNVYGNADMKQADLGTIRIYRPNGSTEEVPVVSSAEGHGGGDARLREVLFKGGVADPLGRQADSMAGAASLLIGATANRSIAEGRALSIPDLSPVEKLP